MKALGSGLWHVRLGDAGLQGSQKVKRDQGRAWKLPKKEEDDDGLL